MAPRDPALNDAVDVLGIGEDPAFELNLGLTVGEGARGVGEREDGPREGGVTVFFNLPSNPLDDDQ
ncbi:MAG: hypothetical protein JHD15_00765 [Phenylobacterium sp.]|nr:hypothetical protein [Phenylobacterium sp.]MBJ7408888.1 hypothetical protein [Phenylobacterium sp.]